jgi:MoxR-like ATPases
MSLTSYFKNRKEQQQNQVTDDSEAVDGKLPVNRDYDFSDKIPDNSATYRQHGREKTKILADLKVRGQTDQLPRYLIGGPTGSGKTHLARSIASEKDIPLFTVQGKYSMDEADLLGTPMLVNESTVWSDGPITKALLASQEQK